MRVAAARRCVGLLEAEIKYDVYVGQHGLGLVCSREWWWNRMPGRLIFPFSVILFIS
jgi:hypothetical protein